MITLISAQASPRNTINKKNIKGNGGTPSFSGRNDVFINNSRYWIKSAMEIADKYINKIDYRKGSDAYKELGQYEFIRSNRTSFENMLNFENISTMSKKTTLDDISSFLKMATNYNENTAMERTEELIKRKIDKLPSSKIKNPLDFLKNKMASVFNKGSKKNKHVISETENIEKECWQEFYKEKGRIDFIKSNNTDFQSFMDSVKQSNFKEQVITVNEPNVTTHLDNSQIPIVESKPPTPGETVVGPKGSIVLPQKTHIEQYQELLDQSNEAWAKSNEATAKNGGFYDEQLKEAAHKASRECSAFEEKAGKENFSLVVKKNLANVTNEEKLEYFTKHVFPRMKCSEASAFDGLDMFEKDGIRERYGKDNIKKTLESLTAAIPKNPSDGLISRYVDVYGKYAQKVSKDFRDSDMFAFFLSGKYRATGDIRQNISEETLLKAIALLKKITYRGEDATTLECAYTGKQFESTRFKNNPKVIAAVEDFKEYVKQFPLYGGQIS